MSASSTRTAPQKPPLRVRTVRRQNAHYRVGIDLGQRNAVFVTRTMTLRRLASWAQAFAVVPEPGYDLVHSLNAVPLLTRRPYVISFENYLPRVPEDTYVGWLERALQHRLLEGVRSGRCLRLFAFSEFARRQFRRQNRDFHGLRELEERLEILYPVVATGGFEPKRQSERVSLLFVGYEFVRKGGLALLRAHEQLRQAGVPVDTHIVSSLSWAPDDFIGPPSREYVERELQRLHAEGVRHDRFLPNDQVMRLMREADYLVLPTLHETFGYVALEALSRGTPVIATGAYAMPEIVEDGACGFLLPLETDEIGRWEHLYRTGDPEYQGWFEETTERLAQAIVDTVTRAWAERGAYEARSAAALERMRRTFSVEDARRRLEDVYELARR